MASSREGLDEAEEPFKQIEGEKMTDLEQFSRQLKPFIDENLQFQMPSSDTANGQMNNGVCPVYYHYLGNQSPDVYQEINEKELYYAIREAENSYSAWQKRKDDIAQLSSKNKYNLD